MITNVLVVVLSILLFINFTWSNQKRKKYPPGPFAWPFIGNLHFFHQMSRKCGGQHLALLKLSRRYNSDLIALQLGRNSVIAVSGHKGIHAVLKSEEYVGRPWDEFIKLRNMGMRKGITMSDGPEWKEIRSWFVRRFRDLGFGRSQMFSLIKDELFEVLENLKEGGVRYLKPVIINAVINVLWTLAAGKRISDEKRHPLLNTLLLLLDEEKFQAPKAMIMVHKYYKQPDEHDTFKLKYFINLMERRAKAFSMDGGVLSSLPWIRYIAPEASGYNLLMTLNKELKSFLMETIQDHKKNYVAGTESDLIDMFLQEMYSGKGPSAGFNEDQLVLILMDLFIAGIMTTSTTLDFLFLNVLIHQDVQRKVHQELDSVIGQRRLPEMNDKQKNGYQTHHYFRLENSLQENFKCVIEYPVCRLPYLEAVTTESQRLCLVTPVIGPRRVLRDTELLGYHVPKDTSVLINVYSSNTNEDRYENPLFFMPERFIKNGSYQSDDNLILYGQGKRRCPGEVLARSAIFLIFAGVLQRFELHPVSDKELPALNIVPGLTISPKPYEILLTPRKKLTDLLNPPS